MSVGILYIRTCRFCELEQAESSQDRRHHPMTEIVISLGAEHDRRSPIVSIRVSLLSVGAREARSPQSTTDDLGAGPLLPDSSALSYRSDQFFINVESDFGMSFAQGKPPHD